MILSAQSIRSRIGMITPFVDVNGASINGLSYGLSACGYDIRSASEGLILPHQFRLLVSMEHFDLPWDILMRVVDKSTWARRGICVQNTVAEPGWRGFLTLEITNHGKENIMIHKGDPIAQVIFELLDESTDRPYRGKYQDQEPTPVKARLSG